MVAAAGPCARGAQPEPFHTSMTPSSVSKYMPPSGMGWPVGVKGVLGGGPGHAPMYHQASMPKALADRLAHQREDQ